MPKKELVTSTDYENPHRPIPARLYNRAGGLFAPGSLDVERLLEEARAATGLQDFGDPSFRRPLSVLLDAMEREAELHPLGRAIMRGRVLSMLANRLRVEAVYREHPEIEAIPIRRPIVIAGLQRTGTTMFIA